MFAPANAVQFSLLIPTARKNFKVLTFEGTETISTQYAINALPKPLLAPR